MDNDRNLIHPFGEEANRDPFPIKVMGGVVFLAIFLGIGSGYIGARLTAKNVVSVKNGTSEKSVAAEKAVGKVDKSTFKDKATGFLREGGIDGEGNFHLERPGGKSQNIYLTSTTIDLSKYIGRKLTVWGQTFKARKAGWLMDVGYIEIVK